MDGFGKHVWLSIPFLLLGQAWFRGLGFASRLGGFAFIGLCVA